jgi:hypothetical protein
MTSGTRELGRGAGETSRRTPFFILSRAVGYLIAPLYVAGVGATYLLTYLLERGAGLREETGLAGIIEAALLNVCLGAFAVFGALLVLKRPMNPIGWIMSAIAFMLSVIIALGYYATYVALTRAQPDALAVFGAWIFNCFWFALLALTFVYLPLLFPDGRLLSRRWLPVAVFAGIPPLTVVVLRALMDTLPLNEAPGHRIDNPIGIEGLGNIESLPIYGTLNYLFFVGVVGVVASVVVRFRRSRGVERQQMKWFTSAVVVLLGGSLIFSAASGLTNVRWLEDAGFVLSMVALASLPVAVGIAILRYRLYGIDLIINRALVYAPLTAMLVLFYLGAVVSLQAALRSLTGQESTLAVVASTLAIAALFNPARRRVQGFVDRRFYRRKYDARKTLDSFSSRLRDETDLDVLCDDLTGVIRETMQPEYASLWLRSDTLPKGDQSA